MPMTDIQLSTLGSVIKTAYEAEANTNTFTDAEKSKLSGIENGATADMTAAEIKTAYESNANTNAFTDALLSKLNTIENGATADLTAVEIIALLDASFGNTDWRTGGGTTLTDAEIKTAYENNADTNAFTDAEKSKLTGIETGAEVNLTAAELKVAYESNADTNAFTDALFSKLGAIEAGATADLTAAEIEALLDAYYGNTDWRTGGGGGALPAGGTTGQILAKASNTDGDAEWIDAATGGGGALDPIPFAGFRAEKNTPQVTTAGAFEKVTFETEIFDTETAFANDRFTVPASLNGKYASFHGGVRFLAVEECAIYIRKSSDGGSNWITLAQIADDSGQSINVSSGPVLLTTGDVWELWVFTPSGASLTDTESTFFAMAVLDPGVVSGGSATSNTSAWRGATVAMNAKSLDLSGTSILSWDTEIEDTDGFWDPALPTTFTIPEGITKVRCVMALRLDSFAINTSTAYATFTKNGTSLFFGNGVMGVEPGYNNQIQSLVSGVIDVVAGDEIEVAAQFSDNTIPVLDATYFQIEVIEATDASAGVTASWVDLPVVNGDFETGDLTGWTLDAGANSVLAVAGSSYVGIVDASAGDFILTGGESSTVQQSLVRVYQDVSLADQAGALEFQLIADSWKNFDDADHASIWVELRDSSDNILATQRYDMQRSTIGYERLFVSISPVLDQSYARVWVEIDRDTGLNNNAAVDNVTFRALTVSNNGATGTWSDLGVVNGDFETGDVTGWTVTTGTADVIDWSTDPDLVTAGANAQDNGTFVLWGGNSQASLIMHQDIDVSADNSLFYNLTANHLKDNTDQDYFRIILEGRDTNGDVVDIAVDAGAQNINYANTILSATIPNSYSITTIRVIVEAVRTGGTQLNAAIDNVELRGFGIAGVSGPVAGNVSKVGTPADNQVGVWTGNGTIEGTGNLTFDGSVFNVNGVISSGSAVTSVNGFFATGNSPGIGLRNTAASADAERWALGTNGDNFSLAAINDIGNSGINALEISRTALFIDSIVFNLGNGSSNVTIDSTGNITLSGTVDGRDIAADGSLLDSIISAEINLGANITGTAYDVTNGDLSGNVYKDTTDASPVTITVPPGLTGTEPFMVEQSGTGQITFAAGAGVTINSAGGALSSANQYSVLTLIPKGSDVYTLIGDLTV